MNAEIPRAEMARKRMSRFRRVDGKQDGVEVRAIHGPYQDRRILVSRDPEEPHGPVPFRPRERLHCALRAEQRIQVLFRAQVVDLPQVDPVGPQRGETFPQMAFRPRRGPLVGFRGEEDLLPAVSQGGAVIRFASRVGPGGLEVGDPEIQRGADEGGRLFLLAEGAQDPLAPQSQAGDLHTGPSQGHAGKGHRVHLLSRRLPQILPHQYTRPPGLPAAGSFEG